MSETVNRITSQLTAAARRGEYIMLDVLSAIFPQDAEIELVFLIPRTSEQILRKSVFQSSVDGEYWVRRSLEYVFHT